MLRCWEAGGFPNTAGQKVLNGSGEIIFESTETLKPEHLKNDWWGWEFRIDYVASGSIQYRENKVEIGQNFTPYTPAPEQLGWSTDTLVPTQSQRYLWKFEYIYYSDGSVEITQPVNLSIAGADADTTGVTDAINQTNQTVAGLQSSVSQAQSDLATVSSNLTQARQNLENSIASVDTKAQAVETALAQVQSTANANSQKTAVLENNLDGLSAKFSSLKIGAVNLFKGSRDFSSTNWVGDTGVYTEDYQGVKIFKKQTMWGGRTQYFEVKSGEEYVFSAYVKSSSENDRVTFYLNHSLKEPMATGLVGFDSANSQNAVSFDLTDEYQRIAIKIKITKDGWIMPRIERFNNDAYLFFGGYKLERGNVATDYSPNEADIEQTVAEYKQNADQNYASLQSTVQALDGTVTANKATADQTAQGFSTRIESLETYQSGESTRANQYFESAKAETARQLTAERTAIANDYVAKSTYTEDVTGLRNDLTATTTTANTTKTNLASYQASNDQAVASLQSSLRTTDGNVSSLQTQINAVPGQITSAVSAVEGKIPAEIGAVNLFKGSRDFSGTNWVGGTGVYTEDYQGVKIFKKQSMWGGRTQYFEVKTGEEYVFSAYVKSSAETDRVTFYLNHSLKEPQAQGLVGFDSTNSQNAVSFDLTDEYQRIAIKIKITKDGWIMPRLERFNSDAYLFFGGYKLERGNIPSDWSPAPEDTASQINSLSSQIQQTADGMTLLATKTELNTAKSDLQSGISTATSKADNAQATANSNAQTISTHTTQINALNTGLQSKVSQSDFDSLSGDVDDLSSELTQTANSITASVSSVETKADNAQTTANSAVSKANAAQTAVNTLDGEVVKSASLNLDNNGFVTKVGKTINGNKFATMIAQDANSVKIIADEMQVTADMIVDGAVTAEKLNVNNLSAVNSDLGAIKGGSLLLQENKAASSSVDSWGTFNRPAHKQGLYMDNHGLASSGAIQRKNGGETTPTDMPLAVLQSGELRFLVVDYNDNLENVLHYGLSDPDFGAIRFEIDSELKRRLTMTSSGYLNFQASNYTNWTSTGVSGCEYMIQGRLVLVNYDVTFSSAGTHSIGSVPQEFVRKQLMLTAKGWSITPRDKNAQLNSDGSMHILDAEANVNYRGTLVFSY